MNILSFYFIGVLMMSGFMFVIYRSRKILQKAHVLLRKKIRR